MPEPSPATAAYASDSGSALVRVLDEYLAALQTGVPPDKAELLARHPDLAGQLDSCLAALDFIHKAATPHPATETPAQLGDFRIVRELGRGGMGVVYEAEQVSLGRPVALKVLRFGGPADPAAMDRFRREAETVARLHHTNIVPVFAVGFEAGVHFYAMQLIDGEGLDKAATNKPDFVTVARWGVQAAEALAHAHARGVIHRDIKPANLLLDREGTVWLTDFGLARRIDEVTLTVTGMLMGTPRYMSPEQASAAKQKVDARSDVYSLGATLYELATGKPVYDGNTPQRLLAQILGDDPTPPRRHIPDMPRDLETIVVKCLARDPNDRYATAQELADDLRRFAGGDPIKARRPRFRERAARWAKKHRKQVAILTLTALVSVGLAIGGAIAVVHHLEREKQRAHQASDETYAHLWFKTNGPPLVVEITDENGTTAAKVAVPDEKSVVLWPGTYTVRVSGPWKPVDTWPLIVTPGQRANVDFNMSGEVTFTTDGPPLVGEILDGNDEAVVPPFPIPTEKPVVVPNGHYRVKLRGPWLPVEYEPLHVTTGVQRKVELKLIGRLSLESNGPPLMAEVLNARGERVVPAFTLPTPEPVPLPAGEHTLRLTGPGMWTENYNFTLQRGELASRSLNLNDRAFGTPIKVTYPSGGSEPADAWVVTHNGKTDVIQVTRDGLKRIEWSTGRQVWAEVPTHPDLASAPFGSTPPTGQWGSIFRMHSYHLGDNDPRPAQARLVRPAPDLDGDGEPDLVFASRWVPAVMAVSGKTGKVLWYHTTAPPVSPEMQAAGWKVQPTTGCVPMGEPLLGDIDGDGVPDIITAVHAGEAHWTKPETKEHKESGGGIWIEAISGKTGKLIWSSWLEESARSSIGQRPFASHLTKLDGKAVLAVLAGRAMGVFDMASGKLVRGPFSLDFTPLGLPKVRVGERPLFLIGRKGDRGDELVAVEALDGKVRWSYALGFHLPKPTGDGSNTLDGFTVLGGNPYASPTEWPVLADLDGIGVDSVLVPIGHQTNPTWAVRSGGGVVALDGDTGKPRWEFRFPLPKDGYQTGSCRIKVIPDVTGDGKPDVAVARQHWVTVHPTEGAGDFIEYGVAVVSGADGKPAWTWGRHRARSARGIGEFPDLGRLATWRPGRDGKPQLIVPVFSEGASTADLLIFDSTTGRLDREVKQFGEPVIADLDGDGMPELYAYRPGPPGSSVYMGEFGLAALRGTGPDEWRQFEAGFPGPDVDGDGVPDLFSNWSRGEPDAPRTLVARSGASGRLLWRCELDATAIYQYSEAEDLNGDGVPDLLLMCVNRVPNGDRVRVAAVCGKTGRVLWRSPALTGIVGGKTHAMSEHFQFLKPVRLRPGDVPTVVGLAWVWGEGGQSRYDLIALSGADGHLLWQTPVAPEVKVDAMSWRAGAPAAADLDGDGVKDLVFWVDSRHLVAVSGATGRVLWDREVVGGLHGHSQWRQAEFYPDSERLDYPPPALADLDGKGTFGVAFVHRPKDRDRVVLLDGKDGTERWAWDGPPVRKEGDFGPPDAMTEPRFVRLREGTFVLGVACGIAPPREKGFSPGIARHLVLLDLAGKEYQRRELPGPRPVNAWFGILPLWVADLDGDGFDEIAFRADETTKLIVTRGGLKDEAWSLAYPAGESISTLRPARGGKPGTAILRTQHTVRGFDGKTGRPLWACSGTSAGPLLQPADPAALPLVIFLASEYGTIARRALPVGSDGKFLVPGVK